MKSLALPLVLLVAAAPAAGQSSACVRDSSGALSCSIQPAPTTANVARRQPQSRELSAAALARARAQSQALRDQMDRVTRNADTRAADRRSMTCPSSSPVLTGSAASPTRACGN